MNQTTTIIKGAKEHSIFLRCYKEEGANKGVLQILHGMAECGDSYERFAIFMVEQGYVVYVQDHRKHGRSIADNQKIGYYTDDTWDDMIDDSDYVQRYIMEQEGVKQVILLGHSMGSFLCRNYLIKYGENVEKAIIVGTAYGHPVVTNVGIGVAKVCERFAGDRPSNLLHYMTIGRNNKGNKPGRKDFDWLSRDEKVVENYTDSELCGFKYTPRFYGEMTKGLRTVNNKKYMAKTPKIPLLFIGGTDDPVGDYGKGVEKVNTMYRGLGYDTNLVLIEGARHDVLNETNREEVYGKVLSFINK